MDTGRNIIHASDSPASAEREIGLFFNEDEICDYQIVDNDLIYE
jgi:nucleoside-diphosphate kinase